jgi:hypothetical protein
MGLENVEMLVTLYFLIAGASAKQPLAEEVAPWKKAGSSTSYAALLEEARQMHAARQQAKHSMAQDVQGPTGSKEDKDKGRKKEKKGKRDKKEKKEKKVSVNGSLWRV